ncbi:hypothetical protein H5410_015213 [Solanum commersonii]|uniref:Uncharacterized protein n=1 Tax=Solanum commersonii TaxID=4109 RepID=A0A9J5ZSY0_SOLCO|nr:hypothetical protein H5410_015213 [Solanum commersonii]
MIFYAKVFADECYYAKVYIDECYYVKVFADEYYYAMVFTDECYYVEVFASNCYYAEVFANKCYLAEDFIRGLATHGSCTAASAQIAPEVILTRTDQQCCGRFQKMKLPTTLQFLTFCQGILKAVGMVDARDVWYAMTIVPDDVERVCRFMRGLTFSIRYYVFMAARDGASFQSIVSTAKEAEMMVLEEFGHPKRTRSSS